VLDPVTAAFPATAATEVVGTASRQPLDHVHAYWQAVTGEPPSAAVAELLGRALQQAMHSADGHDPVAAGVPHLDADPIEQAS
jgi:hypothetical protein